MDKSFEIGKAIKGKPEESDRVDWAEVSWNGMKSSRASTSCLHGLGVMPYQPSFIIIGAPCKDYGCSPAPCSAQEIYLFY